MEHEKYLFTQQTIFKNINKSQWNFYYEAKNIMMKSTKAFTT